MVRLSLPVLGGGCVEIAGPWPARRIMIILNRTNYRKDEILVADVRGYFHKQGFTIVRYDTEGTLIGRRLRPKWTMGWPRALEQLAKTGILFFTPWYWRYFCPGYRKWINSLEYEGQCLSAVVAALGQDKEISVFSRSASGRVASRFADELALQSIVCLGYPFQYPGGPVEPERFEHLSAVETPFLIVQGRRDAYGGAEVPGKYRFSPSTHVELVDTDHDFKMADGELQRTLEVIRNFLTCPREFMERTA